MKDDALTDYTKALEVYVKSVEEALKRYGKHDVNCPTDQGLGVEACSCGLTGVWNIIKKQIMVLTEKS